METITKTEHLEKMQELKSVLAQRTIIVGATGAALIGVVATKVGGIEMMAVGAISGIILGSLAGVVVNWIIQD